MSQPPAWAISPPPLLPQVPSAHSHPHSRSSPYAHDQDHPSLAVHPGVGARSHHPISPLTGRAEPGYADVRSREERDPSRDRHERRGYATERGYEERVPNVHSLGRTYEDSHLFPSERDRPSARPRSRSERERELDRDHREIELERDRDRRVRRMEYSEDEERTMRASDEREVGSAHGGRYDERERDRDLDHRRGSGHDLLHLAGPPAASDRITPRQYGTLTRFDSDDRPSATGSRHAEWDMEAARERESRDAERARWRAMDEAESKYFAEPPSSLYTSSHFSRRSSRPEGIYPPLPLTHTQLPSYAYAPTSSAGYATEHGRDPDSHSARGRGVPVTMPSPPGHGRTNKRKEQNDSTRAEREAWEEAERQRRDGAASGRRQKSAGSGRGPMDREQEEPIDVDMLDGRSSRSPISRGEEYPRDGGIYAQEEHLRRRGDRDMRQSSPPSRYQAILPVQPQIIHGLPSVLQGASIQAFQPYYPSEVYEDPGRQPGWTDPYQSAAPRGAYGRDHDTSMSSSRSGESLRDRRSSAAPASARTGADYGNERHSARDERTDRGRYDSQADGSRSNGHHARGDQPFGSSVSGLAAVRAHFDREVQEKDRRDRQAMQEWEHSKAILLTQLIMEERRKATAGIAQTAKGSSKSDSTKKHRTIKPATQLDDELMDLAEEDARSASEGDELEEKLVPDSSPQPVDPEQKALQDALAAHEDMFYPTKGMRNKDGTLRKKPGPPKGIKKGQSKRQFLEESAMDRLLGRVKDEDDQSDTPSGSAMGRNKKRKLHPQTSEMGSQPGSRQASPAGVRRRRGSGQGGEEDFLRSASDASDAEGNAQHGGSNGYGVPPPNGSRPLLAHGESDSMMGLQNQRSYEDEEADVYPVPPRWQPNLSGFSQPPVVPIALDGREYESPPPDASIVDNNTAYYRADCAERMQWLLWTDIVQKQIPQAYKYVRDTIGNKQDNAKKIAVLCARAPRRQAAREKRTQKDLALRAKKAAREAIAFWRKNEREEIENRKRAEREALEKAKAAEAAKEKEMAARRLNYLLSSGEMYSRLMKKKIRTDEAMDSGAATPNGVEGEPQSDGDDDDAMDEDDEGEDIDLEADGEMTEEAIKKQAARRAKAIMQDKKSRAAAFDKQVMAEREQVLGDDADGEADKALTTEGLDFQNPLAGENNVAIAQPKMLMATLKDYQLKGLSWLGNLYESGINGILADEMGLGKTIQSISLLAYLAEVHNIWGPFLVVAPASTVHNWQQELTRFVPRLKALPYWGIEKDRKILRRDWNRKSITFTEDAPFHIVVTSYEMAVRDEAAFQKVRWQYMILDEAQAVKNATSLRWQTLLTLKTRNRLLLTGTPIQNSMNELWALLHFIMPELFSSLNDFTEWFSKGIEGATGMRDNNLSAKQLKRLHDVLRPFMLRRVKKNVQSELGEKIEIDLVVDLSPRQRSMYRALRTNASVRALLASATDTSDTAANTKTLMNIVMQFRKVCGHPDLFERADVASPYSWGTFSGSGELMRQTMLYCPDSCRNPIAFELPRLVWNERKGTPSEDSQAGSDTRYLGNLMNIWNDNYIAKSDKSDDYCFGFLHLRKAAPSDLRRRARQPFWQTIFAQQAEVRQINEKPWAAEMADVGSLCTVSAMSHSAARTPSPGDIAQASWRGSWSSRPEAKFYLEKVVSPPVYATCSSRSFERHRDALAHDSLSELALYGLPGISADQREPLERARAVLPDLPPRGLLGSSPLDQTPTTAMRFPSMKRLIFDSAKLARLDSLLRELKAGGHRVLIYFQMTKMMGIVEEYLIYRQLKYLRLDGSTPIGDRRDLVGAWQTNPDLFVFMLSTKAGGLGINLTAADTVIFYDHDWNPSSDSQAMDRAHRVGQTRQVTVYRLICRHTIDERILQLARTKKDVQDIVVGTKTLAEVNSQKEIVSLLMDDDEDAGLGSAEASTSFGGPGFGNSFNATSLEDEDDEGFFAQKKGTTGAAAKVIKDGSEEVMEGAGEGESGITAVGKGKGKKRKAGAMAEGAVEGAAPKKKYTKKVKTADDADSVLSEPKAKKTRAPRAPKARKQPKGKKAGSPLKQVVPADSPSVDAEGDVDMDRLAPLDG